MNTAVDHAQLAAPPGSEGLLRAYDAGVLGMTEIPKPSDLAARGGGRQPPGLPGARSGRVIRGGGKPQQAPDLLMRNALAERSLGLAPQVAGDGEVVLEVLQHLG